MWELADRKQLCHHVDPVFARLPVRLRVLQYHHACSGTLPRVKTSAQIIRELDGLYNLGWREPVFFVDDNLIGNKKHLREDLLPALIEWRKGKKGMPFNTEISINIADDEP